jgi:hypothetical protein
MGVDCFSVAVTQPPAPLAAESSIVPAPGPSRLTRWLCASGAVGVCAAGLAFVYLVDPNPADNPYPRCLMKVATGIDCPGCGGTRALHSLLHGDIGGAADHNIIVFPAVVLTLYIAVRFALQQFDITLPAPRLRPWMGYVALVFLLVFTVARNIPNTPFWYFNSGIG